MDRIFDPSSIVVIGVSEKPDNLARNILGNLRAFGYRGPLYAVGRQAGEVHGVPIVDSLEGVPDGIDLAVILTPAALVPGLLESCGRKRITRAVIESGGFGEFSPEGRQLEEQLLEIARRHEMRFVGPNCISVVNLPAGVCLPFVPLDPGEMRPGPASVVAQSGGVSITYLLHLSLAGVGVCKGVSIGNKTQLDEADYLQSLLADRQTEMVVLYLESIGDGRRLLELARNTPTPLIVHKANRTQASRSVAFSHTAALADDDRIVSGAFRQAGIVRAESFDDTAAIAQGLTLPAPGGDDLVIIARSGGHAVIAADAAERHGFRLGPLPETFARAVREFFRADVIAPTNPLDLGAIFDFDLYARIVEQCLTALSPDAVLLINTYGSSEAEGARRLAQRVQEIVQSSGLPIAFCAYARPAERARLQTELSIPVFRGVEDALRGLAAARDRRAWLARRLAAAREEQATTPPRPRGLPEAEGPLNPAAALALCKAYRIPTPAETLAPDPAAAAAAAEALGFPVALKLMAASVVHKSEVGGVALGLADAQAVRAAGTEMLARHPAGDGARLLVQRMAPRGVEIILGGKRDPSFGPVVMVGLGGVLVELYDDVVFRVAPLTRLDAEEMLDELRGRRLLEGLRGAPPAARPALVEAIVDFSRLLVDHPRLLEFEINPLIVGPEAAFAVDARGRFESPGRDGEERP